MCFLSVFTSFVHAQISIDTLISRADQLRSEKKYEEAERVLDEALQYEEASTDMNKRGLLLNNLNHVLYKQGKFKQCIYVCTGALETYKKTRNDTLIADSYYNLGLAYKKLGILDEASRNYLLAAREFEKLNLKSRIGIVYNSLGNIERDLKRIPEAIKYHNQSLQIRLEANDSLGVANTYHNLGQDYNQLGNFETARNYLRLAKKINLGLGRSVASNESQIGMSHLYQENLDSAQFYLFRSLDIRKREGTNYKVGISYKHLGNLFLAMNEKELALTYLDSAFTIASEEKLNQELVEILETQIEIEKTGNYGSDLVDKYDLLMRLRDSVIGEKVQVEINRIEVQYGVLETKKELSKKTNEFIVEKAKNETLELKNFAFLIGIIIISVFIIIIAFFLIKLRKSKAETEQKNQELKESKAEIENLHKELSHRTKNYYQMFGGILKYDRKKVENAETQRLLDNYIRRVEAMSQIQRYLLEKTTEGHDVQLDLYLSEILSNIDLILNQITPKVHIEERFETISCDYDKALRLGLVMNEMVSNSFEHGFHQIENPELTITLICNEDDIIRMTVSDNGIGMDKTKLKPSNSKGIGLMEMILKSVEGELEYLNTESSGTTVCIRVKK